MNFWLDKSKLKGLWSQGVFLPILLGFLVCLSCSRLGDEEAILKLIDKGAVLAEEHDIGGILELASQNFQAMPGQLDRRAVKGVLWRTFQYYGSFRVLYPRPKVEIEDGQKRASARFPFLIVKKEQALPHLDKLRNDPLAWLREVGEQADLYHLRLALTKSSGTWAVERAFVERFTGLGFEE